MPVAVDSAQRILILACGIGWLAACAGSDERDRPGPGEDASVDTVDRSDVAAGDEGAVEEVGGDDTSGEDDGDRGDDNAADAPVGPEDAAGDETGEAVAGLWVEEFLVPAQIDGDRTTARVDFDAGIARTHARTLVEVTPDDALPFTFDADAPAFVAGRYLVASLDAGWDGELTVEGGLTLLVDGDARIAGRLRVNGDLTIASSGALHLDGAHLVATGAVRLHQHGDGVMQIGPDAVVSAEPVDPAAPGDGVEILSRGDVAIGTSSYVTASANDGSERNMGGEIVLMSYGSLSLGENAFIDGGMATGARVWVEGDIALSQSSFIYGGYSLETTDAAFGPTSTDIRAGGDIVLGARATIGGDTTTCLVRAGGRFEVQTSAEVIVNTAALPVETRRAATALTIEAAEVLVHPNGYINGGWEPWSNGAAPLVMRTTGPFVVQGTVQGIGTGCGPAGPIVLETESDLDFGAAGRVELAFSRPRGPCEIPESNGTALLRAAGRVTAGERDSASVAVASGGRDPLPLVTVEAGVAVTVAPIDLGFSGTDRVVSWPIAVTTDGASVAAAELVTRPGSTLTASLLVARDDASSFDGDLTGEPLSDGWRYALEMPWRMLDGPIVDSIALRW